MKPHANEVRSKFLEGMDTDEIAKHFGIEEYEAVELLQEARASKFKFNDTLKNKRGSIRGVRAMHVAKTRKSVSLAPVKFLEAK